MPAGRRRRGRPSRNATASARSRTSGLAVTTTVVRPAAPAWSRAAILASVCASTALVGSTRIEDLRVGEQARGRARAAGVGRRRTSAPRSSTSSSSPSGSASRTSSAAATETAARMSASVAPPQGSSTVRSVPENSIGSGSPTRMRRRTASSGSSRSGTPPSVAPAASGEAAEPVRERRRLVRVRRDDARQRPGLDHEAGVGVGERRAGRRLGDGCLRVCHRGLDREDVQHPPRADDARASPCPPPRPRCAAG